MSPAPAERRTPHPDRLSPKRRDYDDIMRDHDAACVAGRAGYVDRRTGLFVMTVDQLWARGTCCDSGCRHCPWFGRP